MSRRRKYRSSGSSAGSPWWISGVYAVGLGVALFVILSVSGNSDSPGFMHQMFFGSSSEDSDASDASTTAGAESAFDARSETSQTDDFSSPVDATDETRAVDASSSSDETSAIEDELEQ